MSVRQRQEIQTLLRIAGAWWCTDVAENFRRRVWSGALVTKIPISIKFVIIGNWSGALVTKIGPNLNYS